MKIGISCYPSVGGSGFLATRLGLELAKKGHEIHFITYDVPYLLREERHPNLSINLIDKVEYPLFKAICSPFTLLEASKMTEVVKEHKLDILHAHYIIPHAMAAFIAKELTGVKTISTAHGSDVHTVGMEKGFRSTVHLALRKSDYITSVSNFLANSLREKFKVRCPIETVYNFVDTEIFRPRKIKDEFYHDGVENVVVSISNFRKIKRIPLLIRAFAKVLKELPESKLILVGDGPERTQVLQLCRKLGICQQVSLEGFRTDIPRVLNCVDLLAAPSKIESFCLVLIEAMACEVPVVSTRAGGIPEVVEHGKQGLLFEDEDVDQLAQNMIQILTDKQQAKKMGISGRKRVLQNFSIGKIVPQYENCYKAILS
ncbi:MAG: N-acetyl-alpha-D-glucosaminyl L-malate synthase BshA [Candidatus Heimdallarchaeota archaeon]|nr:N-acetyl-alpha-D-glucosaminyl L-malate synthase BshA [Candidatus Heimdallarchaeota archaeon]